MLLINIDTFCVSFKLKAQLHFKTAIFKQPNNYAQKWLSCWTRLQVPAQINDFSKFL